MDQNQIWSKRYGDAGEDYLFGTAPCRFLERRQQLLGSGSRAISIADGEGRNSVWLAEQGLAVTAVEISPVGLEKARRLAHGRSVEVEFVEADMMAPEWPPAGWLGGFDWVVAMFIQFVGAAERPRQFARLRSLVAPGGCLLLHGYTPRQLDYRTGGPSALENLYTATMLRDAFADWTIEELVEYEDDLAEGNGHCGRSALIGAVVRRPVKDSAPGRAASL